MSSHQNKNWTTEAHNFTPSDYLPFLNEAHFRAAVDRFQLHTSRFADQFDIMEAQCSHAEPPMHRFQFLIDERKALQRTGVTQADYLAYYTSRVDIVERWALICAEQNLLVHGSDKFKILPDVETFLYHQRMYFLAPPWQVRLMP